MLPSEIRCPAVMGMDLPSPAPLSKLGVRELRKLPVVVVAVLTRDGLFDRRLPPAALLGAAASVGFDADLGG